MKEKSKSEICAKENLDSQRRDRRIQTAMRATVVSVSDQAHVRFICVSNPSIFGRDIQSVTPVDALHIKSHTCFPVKTKRLLEEKLHSMHFLNSKGQSLTAAPDCVNLKISQNSHSVRHTKKGTTGWWSLRGCLVFLSRMNQSQFKEPELWYSVTLVSKKFFSLDRSIVSLIQGKGFAEPY